MVQALEVIHAEDFARSQHSTACTAMSAELLDGLDRHKMLRVWFRGEGAWRWRNEAKP
jgi:hypothetical protein